MFNINDKIMNERYVATPYALFTNPKYEEVDHMAKYVYSFLLSKLALSQKNHWCDKDGNLYCKASVRSLALLLGTSKSSISRKLSTLENVGLILRKHVAWCHADLIFLNKVEECEMSQNDNEGDSCPFSYPSNVPRPNHVENDNVPPVRPDYKNNITKEIHNVKQQHNIESTNSMYTQAQEDSSDVDVVMSTLNSFGFVKSLAVRAIKQYGVRRVREAIEIMRSQIDNVRNKAAFIYSALKNNYQLTKKQENTTPIVQIATESDSKGVVEEDRSNHTNEPANTPCEPSTEKYVVQERPKVDTESEEKVQAMKDWIGRIYKQRGEVVGALHRWMENHGLKLNENGDVVPAV